MIEKSVLKALRALCRHGLPRPFGHAYAVERGPENHPARLPPKALDAINRHFCKWSDSPKPHVFLPPLGLTQGQSSFIGIDAKRAQFAVQLRALHSHE